MKRTDLRFLASTGAVLLTATAATSLSAGTATMQSADGEQIVWEYQEDAVRMNIDNAQWVVIRGGSFYLVSYEDGEAMVIDGGSMMRGFASMMPDVAPAGLQADVVSFEATGRSETIAGLRGDVYELRIRDEDGQETVEELVLSDSKEAKEFSEALILMAETVAQLAPDAEESSVDALSSRLRAMNAGVLRYGQEVLISSISSEKIADVRFELPAEPMDFGGLGGMMGGLPNMEMPAEELEDGADQGSDDNGEPGLTTSIMGIFGKKVDRQSDRVSSSMENEVDRKTDETVDKQVKKVFDKLFGS
ncbi:MAG: hypothetical protein AAGG55_01215 [Pseudomonadota bacterium]